MPSIIETTGVDIMRVYTHNCTGELRLAPSHTVPIPPPGDDIPCLPTLTAVTCCARVARHTSASIPRAAVPQREAICLILPGTRPRCPGGMSDWGQCMSALLDVSRPWGSKTQFVEKWGVHCGCGALGVGLAGWGRSGGVRPNRGGHPHLPAGGAMTCGGSWAGGLGGVRASLCDPILLDEVPPPRPDQSEHLHALHDRFQEQTEILRVRRGGET